MTIDAHHHLWRYTTKEYGWIDDSMAALRRDFLLQELCRETAEAGINGTLAVQARQSLEETHWLLDRANESDVIRGVIGWAPLMSSAISRVLSELSREGKLKGLRHIIQDEPDENFLLREDFNRGISAMADTGLVYDILIFPKHFPAAIAFVDRHPHQRFVLDHIGKPSIRAGADGFASWSLHLRELARRPNVACKVSGMATEADWSTWSLDTLRPYLDTVVESFGPRRLMAGSDWPVCLVATGYKRWFDTLREYLAAFSEEEQSAVLGGNAIALYRLQHAVTEG